MPELNFSWLIAARSLTLLVGGLALLATLLPLLRQQAWWIRVFDFPRLQIVGVMLPSALIAWLLGMYHGPWGLGFLALLLVGSVYQLIRILPYTTLRPKQVADSKLAKGEVQQREISLLVTNVLMTNRDAGRCLRVIHDYDPDIILAVETDQWWLDQLAGLEKTHPYTALAPLPNTYGLLVFSRLKLVDAKIRFLIDDDIPSFHSRVELPSGELVRLHCLHPKPPAPAESKTSTRRDAELLLVGQEIEDSDEPTIVAGDMNDVAWSHTSELFRRISGLLDPRIGRGLLPTFHADYSLLRWPLDHIFHSAHFKVKDIQRLPYVGSDHFPIFLRLSYEPQAEAEQSLNAEKPDAEDEEEVAEKIADGFKEEAEEEREERQAAQVGLPTKSGK